MELIEKQVCIAHWEALVPADYPRLPPENLECLTKLILVKSREMVGSECSAVTRDPRGRRASSTGKRVHRCKQAPASPSSSERQRVQSQHRIP
jgi:hypothetical protein